MTIAVRHHLAAVPSRKWPSDKQRERRVWLAKRIRRYANTDSLGPRYRNVEMRFEGNPDAPCLAIFHFEAWPGADPSIDHEDRRAQVMAFVESLER